MRFQALKAEIEQQKSTPDETLQKEVQDVQTRYKKLKVIFIFHIHYNYIWRLISRSILLFKLFIYLFL